MPKNTAKYIGKEVRVFNEWKAKVLDIDVHGWTLQAIESCGDVEKGEIHFYSHNFSKNMFELI